MKVSSETQRRLVLSANRRLIGVANIAAAPFVLWLGLKIVEEGGTAWFGWTFSALAPVMVVGGVWALLMRLTLTLDLDHNMIRFSLHGITRRKNKIMKLSELDHVTVRSVITNRQEYSVLDFVPKHGSDAETLTIREFWTSRSAEDAAWAIRSWPGYPKQSTDRTTTP